MIFRNVFPALKRKNTVSSFQDSLTRVTRTGTIYTATFFLAFAIIYALDGHPVIAVFVNLTAFLCSLTGYFLITRFELHRLTAHLVTFAIYLSSAGVVLFSGGIHSASIVWQIFVPVASFVMAGLRAGLLWGGISFLTVVSFFALGNSGYLDSLKIFQTTTRDLLFDLGGAIIAVSIAIWFSDRLKARSLAQLEETRAKLNFYATIDPLTNTYNRRHFFEKSEGEIEKNNANGEQASFLLFDIDHFKKINDQHGHIIGDQILKGVAQICLDNLRMNDIFGRFGGEEFVILLPNTSVERARGTAERLRQLIEQTPIETDIGSIHTTISIGVSTMDDRKSPTIDQLLSKADKAMYSAKQAGRNQVIVWDGQQEGETLNGL